MKDRQVNIAIINYPGAMLSAVYGMQEIFQLANKICHERELKNHFSIMIYDLNEEHQSLFNDSVTQVVIIPPDIGGNYYQQPEKSLTEWLLKQHGNGATLCSVCAGAFILAETGLLVKREVTTHWDLADQFSKKYPNVLLDSNKILINGGDIITAGGLMSWLDLCMELVGQIADQNVMRQLGKYLVIDTGPREQRYYVSFSPVLDHGDKEILKAQHFMQAHIEKNITVKQLATDNFLTERTFLRRFLKATELKPIHYLQKLRIQKACDLIETTNLTVDAIAFKVGYGDTSAFRKIFIKIMGLTPREFKNRFSKN